MLKMFQLHKLKQKTNSRHISDKHQVYRVDSVAHTDPGGTNQMHRVHNTSESPDSTLTHILPAEAGLLG